MIGKMIKQYLEKNGILLSYVASKIGVAPNVFSSMMNGKRRISAEEYYLICKALNVDLEYFYLKTKK